MNDGIRLLLAVLLFCLGVYLVWDLFTTGFDAIVLVLSLLCFVAAHYIKPKSNDRDDLSVLDIVNFIVDLPFNAISISIRALGKLFKGDSGGFDL